MRRLTIVVSAAVVAAMVCVAAAPTASADNQAGGAIRDGSPEAVVVVGASGVVASWSGLPRGGVRLRCGYYVFDIGDGSAVITDYPDASVDPVDGGAYVLKCWNQAGHQVLDVLRVFDPADPFAGVAATERAVDEARRRLELPAPRPALNPPGEQLVGVPTWLWLDAPPVTGSATASVAGVAATVTARPTGVRWDMGDGTHLTCDEGTPYDPSRPPRDQHSSCTHAFTHASTRQAGGTYTVTATVTYDVSWTATTGGSGELGALTRSTEVPVRVSEAQALIR